jgi:DNA polymerase-3 subunit gamma/tau
LFTGPHGCGKTTVARIMANEINSGFGEPIEIDAASNNGIDNVRNLINDAQQSSIDCDYKVYIIDECHQLTRAAWDAALKLIEEPPSSAIFIFCTTSPNKVPDTILSRLQRFDFTKIPRTLITDRLTYICNELEDVVVEGDALDRISIVANGHLRDALVLLDKCLDYSNILSITNIECALGIVRIESIHNTIKAVSEGDLSRLLSELDAVSSTNNSIINYYDDLVTYTIDCLIYNKLSSTKYTSILNSFKDDLKFDTNRLDIFLNCLIKFRDNLSDVNAEALLKAIFIKVCR